MMTMMTMTMITTMMTIGDIDNDDNDDDDNDGNWQQYWCYYQFFCQDRLVSVGQVLVHAHHDAVGDDGHDDHVPEHDSIFKRFILRDCFSFYRYQNKTQTMSLLIVTIKQYLLESSCVDKPDKKTSEKESLLKKVAKSHFAISQ